MYGFPTLKTLFAGLACLPCLELHPSGTIVWRPSKTYKTSLKSHFRKDSVWTALRQSIGGDSTAYSMSMSVRSGDVLALLRAVRTFYERRAIPHQTQLRKDLISISITDYPDVKHYIAALEVIFNKLAALGDVIRIKCVDFTLSKVSPTNTLRSLVV